jgi:hypothetical protein
MLLDTPKKRREPGLRPGSGENVMRIVIDFYESWDEQADPIPDTPDGMLREDEAFQEDGFLNTIQQLVISITGSVIATQIGPWISRLLSKHRPKRAKINGKDASCDPAELTKAIIATLDVENKTDRDE